MILYADRDPDARAVVRQFLARAAPVRSVETLGGARRAFAESAPHLLVLDPDLDEDATPLVREATRSSPWTQVFVVCSAPSAARASEYIAAGAADLAVKPFDVGTLGLRVTRLLRVADVARKEAGYRRELEARLAHSERVATLGTLCATVAHEIANPLSLASACVDDLTRELLGDGPIPGARRRALVDATADVRTACDAIAAFLTRIRGFSRRADDERVTASLGATVETALLFLKPRSEGRANIVASFADAPVVSHQPVRVTQALVNVLVNAVEAKDAGVTNVEVSFEESADHVAIVVDDDGPGIPDDVRARLYEPFFTTKPTGTGLGLVLVRSILREHGGELQLGPRPAAEGGVAPRGTRARLLLARG